jgi:hypothetical protein
MMKHLCLEVFSFYLFIYLYNMYYWAPLYSQTVLGAGNFATNERDKTLSSWSLHSTLGRMIIKKHIKDQGW